jgi:hypothetical protein
MDDESRTEKMVVAAKTGVFAFADIVLSDTLSS